MDVGIMDILNFVFLAVIPIMIKFMNDLRSVYIELKTEIVEHKARIEELKEDVKKLENCLYELKKMLIDRK